MHKRQTAVLEALRRIQGFLDDNHTTVAPVNESDARTDLDSVVQRMNELAVDQGAGRINSRGATVRQAALHQALRVDHMRPIAVIAGAQLRNVPEMTSFTVPKESVSNTELVTAARAMADAAVQYHEVFLKRGLADDFVPKLLAAAQALNDSFAGRTKSIGRTVGATSAIVALDKQGREIIKSLDALVQPKLRAISDNRLLGEWRAMKRIHKTRGGTTSPASGETATPLIAAHPQPQPVARAAADAPTAALSAVPAATAA